jgi:hypothetical protein
MAAWNYMGDDMVAFQLQLGDRRQRIINCKQVVWMFDI